LVRGFAGLVSGADRQQRSERSSEVVLDCTDGGTIDDGSYSLRSAEGQLRISGSGPRACLYGAFALLRELSQGADPDALDIASAPAMPLRLLNHWDNPDG